MREKLLIDILRDKEIVSLKNIISTLSLSERTIRTQIKNLNTDGKKHGFIIDNIRGKGYRLKVIDYIKFEKYYNYLIKKVSIENTYNQEERVNKILEIFLFAKENLTIDNIAKKLDYSRSTIIKDLVLVDKKLKQFNLSLEKRSNKGIKINSDEIDIRKAISSYIYSNTKYCDFEDETKNNIFIIAKKIFIEEIIENKIDISNIAIENIFCYLKILIFRIENKNFLSEKL
ncbi:HTH domain-containing protein, partial [Clostridium perfringens]